MAHQPTPGTYEHTPAPGAISASDQTARERVVGECARVAERLAKTAAPYGVSELTLCAKAIRALATERSGAPASEWRPTRNAIAMVLLSRRGFGFYADPMEGGQDAYDITCEALDEADAVLALLPPPPSPSSTAGGRS